MIWHWSFHSLPPLSPHWTLITRLGEAALLLPCALLLCLWLRYGGQKESALRWIQVCAVASLLTLFSKLAFIGWGASLPGLNFTGVSGHSMLAALVLPALMYHLALGSGMRQGTVTIAAKGLAGAAVGIGLAVLVGISRLALQAHSLSEVLAGLLLGFAACFVFLAGYRHAARRRPSRTLLAAVAVLALGVPATRIEMPTQHWLERIVVYLSGLA
ncbi:phosphatase PAP2 family protein [Paracidovorax citrulli]